MALTALAGPMANFLLSILLILAAVLLEVYAGGSRFVMALAQFFVQTGQLSVSLGVFNLLPIPPLDGSRVLQVVLPDSLYYKFYNYQAYFQIALILLLFLGAFNNILYTLQASMTGVILRVVSALLGLFGI